MHNFEVQLPLYIYISTHTKLKKKKILRMKTLSHFLVIAAVVENLQFV